MSNQDVHTLPECLQGVMVTEAERFNFWQEMAKSKTSVMQTQDFMRGMVLESEIMIEARRSAYNHGAGMWQYVFLDRENQLFYMYPDANQPYMPSGFLERLADVYGVISMDCKAYGFYVSLIALKNHAANSRDPHWIEVYKNTFHHVYQVLGDEIETKWAGHDPENKDGNWEALQCFATYNIISEILL